ncbi:hypothetical protein [Nocardia cyriacigeorgica]|uniref:hypothetical protein n=1 Tax=Nocardia cyriacigeorgica TaxID=135487 RepID=UPI00189532E3|nr:hypothetical protein [Nocardia cyriacigeorgica]MBF6416939.1 hypothetical protein [Nocardia cyriacigeorgica]
MTGILRTLATLALLAGLLAWLWTGEWRYAVTGLIVLIIAGLSIPHLPQPPESGKLEFTAVTTRTGTRVACDNCAEVLHDGPPLGPNDIRTMMLAHHDNCTEHNCGDHR